MINILWQVGIITAILVFGIKIGLASGLANLSKKYLTMICVSYGLGILILSMIASFYTNQLTIMLYTYNSIFFMIMALIMILAGILTIREWKLHKKNTSTATCLVVIAPCPCCFGVIIATILLVAPTFGLGIFDLSLFASLGLILTIILTYYLSNKIMGFISKPYPIVLGNFELFLGVYFLLSAIVLPNISNILGKSMSNINLEPLSALCVFIVLACVLLFFGVFINKKSSLLE